ncbi:hypothetical protein PQR39_25975 [Paraburkholderia sediminicola]|uniref:hypothetical protein n=1 Tax=Paraburkholderia sediminicola TaxID=458836 RepID=UPI0038B770FD
MLSNEQLVGIALEHGFGPAMLAGGGSAVAGKPEHFLPMLRAVEQASRRAALEEGYALGFNASGEGWNGEHPCIDYGADAEWVEKRDALITAALVDGVKN